MHERKERILKPIHESNKVNYWLKLW